MDRRVPSHVTRRYSGQTALFGKLEWIFSPGGLTASSMRQIERLSAKGEGPIIVIQWPAGEVVFEQGKWKDRKE